MWEDWVNLLKRGIDLPRRLLVGGEARYIDAVV